EQKRTCAVEVQLAALPNQHQLAHLLAMGHWLHRGSPANEVEIVTATLVASKIENAFGPHKAGGKYFDTVLELAWRHGAFPFPVEGHKPVLVDGRTVGGRKPRFDTGAQHRQGWWGSTIKHQSLALRLHAGCHGDNFGRCPL